MRQPESAYWDSVADFVKQGATGGVSDNIWKRCAIISRVLAHRPVKAKILEIGVGHGTGTAAINLLTLGNIHYTGTDVSEKFCQFVERRWKLKVVQTDVTQLPDGPYDMIWAFDTLEHVRPEDREKGNAEINRVLAEHGVILLNVPRSETAHDEEFDWGLSDADILQLAHDTGTTIAKWEPYYVEEVKRSYLWVELCR